MKKFFSLIAAVLFAGSMMAADAKVVLDLTDDGWGFPTAYTKTAGSYTNGGYTLAFGESNNGHKVLTKSNTDPTVIGIIMGKQGATLSFPAMSFDVSKIIVYYATTTGSTSVKHNIFVGEDAVSTEVVGCSLNDRDGSVFNIAAAKQAAGNVFVLKVTSAHNMQVSKVEFYEAVAGAPENPTFSVAAGTYTQAQSVELACATEGAEIHYTLDGTDPDASSDLYSAPIAVAATTTIKAVAIKSGVSSDIVSATYTIIELDGEGTQENPFTVADVRKLNNSLSGKHWVMGYIVGCASNGGALADSITNPANIALGDAADQTENCVPVQLTANTDPRAALNLKDNPGNLYAQVKVYGDLTSYFSFTGVKNVTDYEIVGGVTPPAPVELDIVANEYIVYDVDGYFDLFMYSSDTWSYDYDDGWTVGEAGYALILDMVYTDMSDVTGTYSSADGSLDASYSSFVSWDGASENLTVAKLASGTVTIAWKDESHSAYVVTYDVIDVNGVNYKGTAEVDPYEEEEPPTADTEVTTSVADATLEDYLSDEYFVVSGTDADGVYFQMLFYPATAIEGSFTEEDLYASSSAVVVGEDVYAIYSATITIVANADGSYTITGDLLCYNNTLYHLTMTVPASPAEGIEEILATGKAVKVVRDGQVVVLKADKAFNMNGQIVK